MCQLQKKKGTGKGICLNSNTQRDKTAWRNMMLCNRHFAFAAHFFLSFLFKVHIYTHKCINIDRRTWDSVDFSFQKALYKSEKIYTHINAKKLDNVSISMATILKQNFLLNEREKMVSSQSSLIFCDTGNLYHGSCCLIFTVRNPNSKAALRARYP